ncbi:GNAT family N-acetyltransferase [Sphingomonas canadensis]|uniref:GNAT family N-acetyltransferase n=1 Tax=Sphingomonas canadensis TaxID=1219257 RepID=A0ABW3H690_9SPHN|nr:GNAT family N-acetyltransferase [Sphingomonas canadensis]MCW3835172.1 GNAT family N-acetyltransferase [Sphingomonas canadensis]
MTDTRTAEPNSATLTVRWATPGEMEGAARFFARTIVLDRSYVSHGEIQTGLSLDGTGWAPDLEEKFVEDLGDPGPDRQVALAYLDGKLAGAAIVLWVRSDRVSYMVIEDVAVDPAARSAGVGRALIAFVEAEGRAQGIGWSFLESGLGNEGAHHFFEGLGYAAMSKVFARRLDG